MCCHGTALHSKPRYHPNCRTQRPLCLDNGAWPPCTGTVFPVPALKRQRAAHTRRACTLPGSLAVAFAAPSSALHFSSGSKPYPCTNDMSFSPACQVAGRLPRRCQNASTRAHTVLSKVPAANVTTRYTAHSKNARGRVSGSATRGRNTINNSTWWMEKHSISRARQRPDNAVCPFWQRAAQGVQQQNAATPSKRSHTSCGKGRGTKAPAPPRPGRPQRPHLHAARPGAPARQAHAPRACAPAPCRP